MTVENPPLGPLVVVVVESVVIIPLHLDDAAAQTVQMVPLLLAAAAVA